MDARKVAFPLLAFAGGAVLGRVLGLKTLMRGAMTAAAVTGMARPALGSSAHSRGSARRRKPVQRGAQRKRSSSA